MNVILWVVQAILAIHTAVGAIWKFSNSEQTVPSLSALPHWLWLGLGGIELLASVGLVLPALYTPAEPLVPIAAGFIVAEMLLFSVVHFGSGRGEMNQVWYWLVVAVVAAFVLAGRLVWSPL